MGREIVYCSQCGVRILEKDLAAGRAFTVLDKVFCAECRDQAFTQAKTAGPPSRPSAAAPARVASAPASRPVSRVGAPAPSAHSGHRTIVHAPNRTPLYIASGVGMLAMVAVIVVIMSKGSGDEKTPGGNGTEGVKSGPKINPNETPEERAARKLNELHRFAQTAGTPEAVLKQAKDSEKDILDTPSEEAFLKFRKQWERKIAEADAGRKIEAWIAEINKIKAADPEFLRMKETMELLKKAEELAMTDHVDRLADIKNLKKEIEEAAEVRADAWMEEKSRGDKIRAFMREGDFKAARSIILGFPEHMKMTRTWKVQLSRNLEDCEKAIAAQAAKAAGKEPEKDWKAHLRIAGNDHNLKNFAKAKESYLKCEAALPPADKLNETEKRAVAWSLYYNLACLYAEESKKLEGAEKAKSVDLAFDYLKKSGEAGVFESRCGCADTNHKVAKDHWDTDKDLETIRSDPRYAEIVTKHAK